MQFIHWFLELLIHKLAPDHHKWVTQRLWLDCLEKEDSSSSCELCQSHVLLYMPKMKIWGLLANKGLLRNIIFTESLHTFLRGIEFQNVRGKKFHMLSIGGYTKLNIKYSLKHYSEVVIEEHRVARSTENKKMRIRIPRCCVTLALSINHSDPRFPSVWKAAII